VVFGPGSGLVVLMAETRTARIEMDPSGCVIVRVNAIEQTVDDARENVAVAIDVAGGPRTAPLLVDITGTAPLVSEVRHYYVGGALAENFTALGLLVDPSPMGRMMGNVFFRMIEAANEARVDRTEVGPTQVFEDEPTAIAWLSSRRR
jgi:hypothetical protein